MAGVPGLTTGPIREYQIVRLARMDRSPEEYAGWADDTRLPQLGEMGTIIDIHALGGGRGELVYVVEGPSRDGAPAWIAEFLQDELEPISGKDK